MNSTNDKPAHTEQLTAIPCYAQPFYSFKDVQIFNENCMDTMQRMPDNHIDLTVTSPPYDNLREYKGYSFPFEDIAKELYRVTKQGGVVVWIVGDATINGSETGTSFRQVLFFMECGFNLHDTMIYYRVSPYPSNNRYNQTFEYMFIFSKGNPNTFNSIQQLKSENSYGDVNGKTYRNKRGITEKIDKKAIDRIKTAQKINTKNADNVWSIPTGYMVGSSDIISFEHPATFPEDLCAKHIYSWSNEGDLIYDCFGGSGTTVKMAHLQNRKAIMSEISKEYCEIAKKRIDPYLRQERLF